jgi:hypothetical protein
VRSAAARTGPAPGAECRQAREFCIVQSSDIACLKTRLRDLAAPFARGLHIVVPQRREQGMPDARCTRGLVCKMYEKKTHTSIQGSGEHPTFPAQWLYGLSRAHPGVSGFLAPVALRNMARQPGRAFVPPQDLTPTIEASGPHDFAVRISTARLHVLRTVHGVYPALQSRRAHDAAASTASHPSVR